MHNFSFAQHFTIEFLLKFCISLSQVNPGDYVIVSTRKRIAIAAGHVYEITKSRISIHLERNLSKNYKNEKFIIDKNVFQSTNVFNYTNLGVLLEDRVESNKLRKIIVNKMKPTFSKEKLSVPKVAQAILLELNSEQRKAVAKAMKMEDYMLLKGLPGTGEFRSFNSSQKKSQQNRLVIHFWPELRRFNYFCYSNLQVRLKPSWLLFVYFVCCTNRLS